MTRSATILLVLVLAATGAVAQTPSARKTTKKPATTAKTTPSMPRTVAAPANVTCPHVLGTGVGSKLQFCDVLAGRSPAEGVLVNLPPHKGILTLSFDLHNRHTYSEQLVKAGRGYTSYTATIGVLTPDGTLLARGVVRSEFRSAKDLLDRIAGGAGPGGVKAVAPTGTERITVDVPEDVTKVSVLGEKLTAVTLDTTETYSAAQRPIAVVSNLNVEYQPVAKPPVKRPAKPPAKKKPAAKK
ncbi:MAG TPA: hypothetical protein VGK32_10625 [Vicinamibacterales bacterium]|jgi:hypothetical protein